MKTKNNLIALLLFFSFFLLYYSTCTRSVQGGDSGEFMIAAKLGGIPHPPGYPLYLLIARGFCWLPWGEPAFLTSLPSVLFGALTVSILFLFLEIFTQNTLAASLSASIFGLTSVFWKHSCMAEVFSLHTFLIGLILFTFIKSYLYFRKKKKVSWIVPSLFFLAGLSFSNHHTIVLITPVFLVSCYFAGKGKNLSEALLEYTGGIIAFLTGLTPYLYLKSLAHNTAVWSWSIPYTWKGLANLFLRKAYGTFKLSSSGETLPKFIHLKEYVLHAWGEFFYLSYLLGALGILSILLKLFQKKCPKETKFMYVSLLFSFFLSSLFFLPLINFPYKGLYIFIIHRFYILPNFLFSIFIAHGLSVFFLRYKKFSLLSKLLPIAASIVLFFPLRYTLNNFREDSIIQDYTVNALKGIEENALILGVTDTHFNSFSYAREFLHIDVNAQYVATGLLRASWYRDKLRRELPLLNFPKRWDNLERATIQFINMNIKNYPVYITHVFIGEISEFFQFYPEGLLVRLLAKDVQLPSIRKIEEKNSRLFLMYELRTILDSPREKCSTFFYEYYAQPWLLIGKAYQKNNNSEKAMRNYKRAQKIVPWKTGFDKWLGIVRK